MYLLTKDLYFPPVSYANEDGILAIGGDLSTERLILAYKQGVFPWYSEGEPIIWYSPNRRMVLFPEFLKISKSMKRLLKQEQFKVTFNKSFESVIHHCKNVERNNQDGTWITDDMQRAYLKLHDLGIAKSVEVWKDDDLVGGLYGVDLGHVFCGESMFSKESNTSKIAFVKLVQKLAEEDYKLIDCQVYNPHLASLGAVEIAREEFLKYL